MSSDNKHHQGPSYRPVQTSPSAPEEIKSPDKKTEIIKDKFLTVAKEKNHLESVILQQNDLITKLEKEKSGLTLSLKKFSDSHKKMKEKLLDFDILRNMEISELKKKIEHLMAENKRLISEKDSIIKNLARDRQNMSFMGSRHETMQAEGEDTDLSRPTDEISFVMARLKEAELERDEARAELYNAKVEVDHTRSGKARAEEDLRLKVSEYSNEITALKTDIDELTSSIENKIHQIEELNSNVTRLSDELTHRDSELYAKVPALLEKINSLSHSIESKMEENSLFAKELFDLNVKISSLNEEILEKDEFLIEIAENYKKQKDEIEALHGAHELTLRNLVAERNLLKKEMEHLEAVQGQMKNAAETLSQENAEINEQLQDSNRRAELLAYENANLLDEINRKAAEISELQGMASGLSIKLEEALSEHAEEIASLNEQLAIRNKHMVDRDDAVRALEAFVESQKSDMEAAAEIANKEKAESDKEMAELQNRLSEYSAAVDIAKTERAALEDELAKAVEKINDLIIRHDRIISGNSRKEQALAELKSEVEKLQQTLDLAHTERAATEAELAGTIQKADVLAAERDSLVSANSIKEQAFAELKSEAENLRQTVGALQAEVAGLEKDLSDRELITRFHDTEKEELIKSAKEYQDTFEDLKKEIISLNRALAEQEQSSARLRSEKEALLKDIADFRSAVEKSEASNAKLEKLLEGQMAASQKNEAERTALLKSMDELRQQRNNISEAKDQAITSLKEDLSAYGTAMADMRARLEKALSENAALRQNLSASGETLKGAPKAAVIIGEMEETLPAQVKSMPRKKKRTFAYALLAMLSLVCTGLLFYAYNTGMFVLPLKQSSVSKETFREHTYNEISAMLTKSAAAEDLKVQATLLTELLILKSDMPSEKALYDFSNNIYFKVSISSPKNGLDEDIAEDPYSYIKVSSASGAMDPLDAKVKQIKTFYKKDEPVSVTFYCSFPANAVSPDSSALTFLFNKDSYKANLTWDLNQLRTQNILR